MSLEKTVANAIIAENIGVTGKNCSKCIKVEQMKPFCSECYKSKNSHDGDVQDTDDDNLDELFSTSFQQ